MGMGRKIILFIVVLFLSGFAGQSATLAQTEEIFNNSGLEIPRFVSLRSNKVFVRTGPALRYPIKWIYTREGMPIEIIQEFDTWRKIKDRDGEEGWIHTSLLSGKRNAVIIGEEDTYLFKKSESTSKKVAMLENDSVVHITTCNLFWCDVRVKGFSGWVERKSLWGVYETEELD